MIKVGVIGLGEVAQLMHLPILADMGELYTVTAVADVSPSLNKFIAGRYGIPNSYLSPFDLINDSNVEAVFILSPDQHHCEYAAAALEAGKHVFIEKPVALNIEELEKLIKIEEKHTDRIAMVGYMRRFAGPFLKAKEIMEEKPAKIEYIRFRDIICEGPFFMGQTRPVFRPTDIPAELIKESSAKRRAHLDVALGADATDEQRTAYQMLTGLGCHSFAAVRELIGLPEKVKAVATAKKGEHLVVLLQYDGFIGTYELVNDQNVVQFDAAIEVFQGNRKLKVKYETPYVRHQPSSLEVIESNDKDTQTTVYGPDYRDAFATELKEFHECIVKGRRPKSTLIDSIADLKLFKEIIAAMGKED